MVQGDRFHGRRLGAVVLFLGMTTLGCASSKSSEVGASVTPLEWSSVQCRACDSAGLVVEARRTADAAGRPGRYTYARVRNLTPQSVALMAEFIMAQRGYDDELLVESRTMDIGPEGESVMLFQHRGISEVAIRHVQRPLTATP